MSATGRARTRPEGGRRHATYLYCVLRNQRRPSTEKVPRGLPGTSGLRALPGGERLWLIVADAPLARYGAAAIDAGLKDLEWVGRCALAHERVVEHFAAGGTVLPTRLFTLFASDARALRHIAGARRRLERELDRVAGRREWGVRLSVDARAARERARERARTGVAAAPEGTRFLLVKKAEQAAASRLAADSRDRAGEVFERLRSYADDARTRPVLPPGGAARLVLDAAFLVPEGKTRAFRSALRRETERLRKDGYTLDLTGPWPPYNFVGGGR